MNGARSLVYVAAVLGINIVSSPKLNLTSFTRSYLKLPVYSFISTSKSFSACFTHELIASISEFTADTPKLWNSDTIFFNLSLSSDCP